MGGQKLSFTIATGKQGRHINCLSALAAPSLHQYSSVNIFVAKEHDIQSVTRVPGAHLSTLPTTSGDKLGLREMEINTHSNLLALLTFSTTLYHPARSETSAR